MSSERPWYAGRVARRSGTRALIDVLACKADGGWDALPAPRKLFPKTGQVELQGPTAIVASTGEWIAFQSAEDGRPGSRQTRVAAHRFLPRFADLRRLETLEAARFLFTREGWDGASEPGHWCVRFNEERVLALQLERARDGRLRCVERSLGKIACGEFDQRWELAEPVEGTGGPIYDAGDAAPLAVHDWSPGADYIAHVVRALAGADDPRLPELITWLELHREERTGRISAIGTDHEAAFEALRSGELAARLTADREVMAAYLAAATRDPAIAAAVEQAAAREAKGAREEARGAAEREFRAEMETRRSEFAAELAARELELQAETRIRVSELERELTIEADRRRAERDALAEELSRARVAEAEVGTQCAQAEAVEAERRRDELQLRVEALRDEVERLEAAARTAADQAAEAERQLADTARRGVGARRPVAAVQRADAAEAPEIGLEELGRRIATCALLTPTGRERMMESAAFALAGEVPVIWGAEADDFALIAEALMAAGRLVPFDADETVITPEDIWSRPGSGLASQVSQAAALAEGSQTHLVLLRGVERSAARFWHPSLCSLSRAGMLPRRLLLFASALNPASDEATALPAGTCRVNVEGAIAPGAALLAARLLGQGGGETAGRVDPGERPADLTPATAAIAQLAADGIELDVALAMRAARVATEAAALVPSDASAAARVARSFCEGIGRGRAAGEEGNRRA